MKLESFAADNIQFDKVDFHMTLSGLQEVLKLGDTLNSLVGQEIDFTAGKHRKKRSLNANSYERVLESKIADALGTSKDEVHNIMLSRYGQYLRDSNGLIVWVMCPDSMNYLKESDLHLKPTGKYEDRNGIKYAWFAQMKPSHEYNSDEFAKLLDGVISECKEMGIEVLSDEEIKRMEAAYGREKDVHEENN